jgi:hypothetical protein
MPEDATRNSYLELEVELAVNLQRYLGMMQSSYL